MTPNESLLVCPECRCDDIVTDFSAGDVICRGCGIVLSSRIIDDSPEWRNFLDDNDADKSRVGGSLDPADSTNGSPIHTVIGNTEGTKMKGLANLHFSTSYKQTDKLLQKGILHIETFSSRICLSAVVKQKATSLFVEANENGLVNSRQVAIVAASVLFLACRVLGCPRTFKEFEAASGILKKKIARVCNTLQKSLELKNATSSLSDYVSRYCVLLTLSTQAKNIAVEVASKVSKLEIANGKSPTTLAASVVYLVSAILGMRKNLREVSEICMIAENNLKGVCKQLNEERFVLFEGVALPSA